MSRNYQQAQQQWEQQAQQEQTHHHQQQNAPVPSYASYGAVMPTHTVTHLVDANAIHSANTLKHRHGYSAFLLWLPPLGLLGAHHLYLKRPGWFVAYFFTMGIFGMGWLIDLCRLNFLVDQVNERIETGKRSNKKNLSDAYIAWLPPFGLLGAHHFFLGRYGWGILYFFTCGIFGMGWLVDICLLPRFVDEFNADVYLSEGRKAEKKTCTAVMLAVFPFTGILGIHHLYLEDYFTFAVYFFTLGNCGLGWLCDLVRITSLVKRANKRLKEKEEEYPEKYLDHAYILWLPPAGILGFHHLYLKRYVQFVLSFLTLSGCGLVWLIDAGLLIHHFKTYKLKRQQSHSLLPGPVPGGTVQNIIIVPSGSGPVPPPMPEGVYPQSYIYSPGPQGQFMPNPVAPQGPYYQVPQYYQQHPQTQVPEGVGAGPAPGPAGVNASAPAEDCAPPPYSEK